MSPTMKSRGRTVFGVRMGLQSNDQHSEGIPPVGPKTAWAVRNLLPCLQPLLSESGVYQSQENMVSEPSELNLRGYASM